MRNVELTGRGREIPHSAASLRRELPDRSGVGCCLLWHSVEPGAGRLHFPDDDEIAPAADLPVYGPAEKGPPVSPAALEAWAKAYRLAYQGKDDKLVPACGRRLGPSLAARCPASKSASWLAVTGSVNRRGLERPDPPN